MRADDIEAIAVERHDLLLRRIGQKDHVLDAEIEQNLRADAIFLHPAAIDRPRYRRVSTSVTKVGRVVTQHDDDAAALPPR